MCEIVAKGLQMKGQTNWNMIERDIPLLLTIIDRITGSGGQK